MMETYIVDASVGAKWFFKEENDQAAHYLLDRLEHRNVRLVVPDFFYIEIGNICWKRLQKRELNDSVALALVNRMASFPLVRYPDGELSDVAFENAIHYGISVYDAVYLSLAEIHLAPLITADDVLIKACKNRFDFILPLKEVRV
ncbi:MAG: hypothetical protein A3C35_02925 [Omnitrophica bacterium RIFCSPHIGHO2_02_FULL_46_11]|nr:MAG: hypothetical protein A3C35_02925 [Omnitrophica bacterium RIFCSPHIGHO2_02_FULL_46_11]OGW84874.1 MAG: hypothetical protein A3A81_00955 [Omnitrophica bacterium RIFCSPLOWO2_01_FULL_45_10b]